MTYSTVALVLLMGIARALAGPCGYGALCGRPACPADIMASYERAYPGLLRCQETMIELQKHNPITATEMKTACFDGPCGASFNDIVRLKDIEDNVCELYYPTRRETVLGYGYYSVCVNSLEQNYPTLAALLNDRLAAARGPPAASSSSPPPTDRPRSSAPSPTSQPLSTSPPTTTGLTVTAPPVVNATQTPGNSIEAREPSIATTGSGSSTGMDTSSSRDVASPDSSKTSHSSNVTDAPPTRPPVPSLSSKTPSSVARSMYPHAGVGVGVTVLLSLFW